VTNNGSLAVGAISEYYVASVLTSYGYDVSVVRAKGYDLIAIDPEDGRIIRVEVKGARTLINRNYKQPRVNFCTRSVVEGTCDVLAFHLIPTNDLVFLDPEPYFKTFSLTKKPSDIFGEDPRGTWENAIKQ